MTKTAKTSTIIVHTDADYDSCLNLRALEKILILLAAKRFTGYRPLMAKELGIHVRNLYLRIEAHGLESILFSKGNNHLIINELQSLKKKFPNIFEELRRKKDL